MADASALRAREPQVDGGLIADRERSADWCRPYALTMAVLDAVAMAVAVVIAQAVRSASIAPGRRSVAGLPFGAVAALSVITWLAAMAVKGTYQRRSLGTGSDAYRRVVDATVLSLGVVALASFVFDRHVARQFVAIAIPVAGGLSLGLRSALRRRLHRQRIAGRKVRNALVVGSQATCLDLIERMVRKPHAGLSPVAACTPGGVEALHFDGTHVPVVAVPDAVLEAVIASRADTVAIADATTLSNGSLRRLAWGLEGTGVDLLVTPAVTDLAGPRISVRPVSDLPLLHVEEPELKGVRRLAKETTDRVVATLALLLLAPLLLVLWVAVRLTSAGPAFFRQARVGVGGREFVIYKFRTMVDGAESRLPTLAHLNQHDGVLFKIRDDPRVTPLGRHLRRWSLDELPQLWNVLRGDMAIVGPRPPLPSEVERYGHGVRRRLLVKPGLTGLWQVSGRSGLSWEESVRLDLYYVENWSLSMDAMILARTVSAVARRRGAC